jgi:hypothetical protein
MAAFLFALVWSAALVLSAVLIALSTSPLSRTIFALAALVALRHLVYGPPTEQRQRQ